MSLSFDRIGMRRGIIAAGYAATATLGAMP
jgi:hypothetical protein